MFTQTRDTINTILTCGLERNQFSVQVDRSGDLQIHHYLTVERAMALSYRLAEYFQVTWHVMEGAVKVVTIRRVWDRRIVVYNVDTKEEYPLKFYVIYFYKDSPEETDVITLNGASDPYALAEREVNGLGEGWNRVDLYRVPFNRYDAIGASEIDLSECGECIASANRDLAEVKG